MKIYLWPNKSDENSYIECLINGLQNNGVEIDKTEMDCKIKKIFVLLSFLFSKAQLYHFNWVENFSASSKCKNIIFSKLFLLEVCIGHILNKKFAWTMHNLTPHNCENKDSYLKFIKKWIKLMDLIVVHSQESIDILIKNFKCNRDKILYVPHGAYSLKSINDHNVSRIKNRYHINDSDKVFLFFGQIDKYKNIPLLIKAFKELKKRDSKLLICGKFSSSMSKDNISFIKKYQSDNVILIDKFIQEDEIADIFSIASVVVLPYDKMSMQNSGSAIMAISCLKPVIIPMFGFIKEISDKSFIFSYDYNNYDEHLNQLKFIMDKFYNSTVDYEKMKIEEIKFIREELNWDTISKEIVKNYNKVIEKNGDV